MTGETKLKIIVLGPTSSGKTCISNFLSDASDNLTGEYRPTKGVRIVEFLAEGLKTKDNAPYRAEVELWDCSGDVKYESCWPAILHKTDGAIFVWSDGGVKQKSDLEAFYEFFVERSGFSDKNCIVMLNESNGKSSSTNPLPKLDHTLVNIEGKPTELRKTFNSFLSNVISRNAKDLTD